MYELFYKPGACSMAVHVLLNEIGTDYTLTKADLDDKTSSLWKANPRGQVPTLLVDGKPLVEGAAILTFLAETHQSPLMPAAGWERAKAQEWLAFANASLHPTYGRTFFLRKQLGDQASSDPLYVATIDAIQKHWDGIEKELATSEYIAGGSITLADILLTVIANWNAYLLKPVNLGAKTKAYLKNVSSRPSYQKALGTEHVDYKAAA